MLSPDDDSCRPIKVGEEEVVVAKSYAPLLKYSFADELPKVSVYVPIDNIETVAKEQVNVTFTKNSFDLIVTDFQGKDLRLAITVRHVLP
jgi:hypothetical protein